MFGSVTIRVGEEAKKEFYFMSEGVVGTHWYRFQYPVLVTIPVSSIGADTGVEYSTLVKSVMPIPQRRYQLYLYAYDNFVTFVLELQ